mmetsp:Transcript_11230/g.14786  ORF Transcript_11230/g.14786 Transcript_11230/m.14786 type:complete len:203 (-) Transcript_11230:188-796(-)|eukprot:CAMPEP_0198151236 /NCGR_PEP_ID=MMETSP1443-20131203/54832_1 /TAXON_ID=186043 /ORGANISM="Entomoneis sp., Strain CCMP2396" /LENGTH=202 /DNA_ID=CAMNT_0043816839 /DNA_START=163 /DNA_END=771 /DNA_ORIENTATION=-
MGNICGGSKGEEAKPSLLEPASRSDSNHDHEINDNRTSGSQAAASDVRGATPFQMQDAGNDPSSFLEHQKKLKSLRLEQTRLDMIVQAAGRRMVAVRSTRGSNAYYDQGFAAALSQHLEQTTKFRKHLDHPLPNPHQSPVYDRLSQPAWAGIQMGAKEGTAGLAGESPHVFFDRVAESVLEEVVPKKERLFAGVEPMVESLL